MKIKKGMVFKTCTAILGLIFLIAMNVNAQDFLHEDDYDKKTKQGIVLVEFWASFNAVNEVSNPDNVMVNLLFKAPFSSRACFRGYKVASLEDIASFCASASG